MLMLSGVSGYQGEVGVTNFTEEEVIVFFSSVVGLRKQNRHRRETLPMEKKKNSYRTEKDEIGGMNSAFMR